MNKIISILVLLSMVFIQSISVNAAETVIDGKLEIEPYSTAQYYWWKQDSSTFLHTEANGGWINHGSVFYASKGQKVCFTPQSTAATIGIDISIAGNVLAGGISYTPKISISIAESLCDVAFPISGNYQAQYKKMYAVYSIKQSLYYYEFGVDYYQYSKTGTLKVNTKPVYRHVSV